MLCCLCRAKLDLPLVHPGKCKAAVQQDMPGESTEPASVRIANREQPYLAHVPLLQDSHLFGVADWYSLVTTLLNSYWDSISSAYGPATQTLGAVNKATLTKEQELCSDWMSWGWLQSFFQALNAQHRQVCILYTSNCLRCMTSRFLRSSFLSCLLRHDA